MKLSLTNNQLKLIAMVAMTLDHVGIVFFPQVPWLRMIGRLAFPIYAYMIAEGCRHTRRPLRYLASVAAMAALCQLVYFFAMGSVYMCILVTFSLSIGLILLIKYAKQQQTVLSWLLVFAGFATAIFLCHGLPELLPHTDYCVDYGMIGVLVPVFVYLGTSKISRLAMFALGLFGLCFAFGGIQWLCLLAVPLLALYNGQRGKWKIKWLFYLFYPAHLVVIQLIDWAIAYI